MHKESKAKKITNIVAVLGLIGMLVFYFIQKETVSVDPYIEAREHLVESITDPNAIGVSASNPLAVEVGMDILKKGGSAADAAVAVSYVLGVVESYGSGIGGGGISVLYDPKTKEVFSYDYRETAPLEGTSANNSGVPGFVAGMEKLHADYGELPLKDLLQPAIDLAEDGFKVGKIQSDQIASSGMYLGKDIVPHYYPNGGNLQQGDLLVQTELADTMKVIQEEGAKGFYEGEIGQGFAQYGIQDKDLSSYQVEVSPAVKGEYEHYDLYTSPPPTSGVTLIQAMHLAEIFHLGDYLDHPASYDHLVGEITKYTYKDRLQNLTDPHFDQADVDYITSRAYAEKELAPHISMDRLSDDYTLFDSEAEINDHRNTTHFVIVDRHGMVVSTTNTLSEFFGSGVYYKGFFLNNQLKNFSDSSNSVNHYEPGKKPRTFMAPSIVFHENGDIIGIGSPGGKRIPTMMMQVLTKYLYSEQTMQEAIVSPRIYTEGTAIYSEKEVDPTSAETIQNMGYSLIVHSAPLYYGGMQSLVLNPKNKTLHGAGDPRRNAVWGVDSFGK